jgi:RHS repeat-associated protein
MGAIVRMYYCFSHNISRVSDLLLPIIPALTNRGFTGYEHIDEMGLIHMNGRVYDPQIGRFLSADPYVVVVEVAGFVRDWGCLKTHTNNQDRTYAYDANGSMTKNVEPRLS